MDTLERLFEPIEIGSLRLKNRIVLPALTTGYPRENYVTDRLRSFYIERARSGVGLIIAGNANPAPVGKLLSGRLGLYDDSFIPGLRQLVDDVHAAGVPIALQITHHGRQATRAESGVQPVSSSAVPARPGEEAPRELTIAEIETLVEAFGHGARRAKQAGFDAIEIHALAGGLISQFLSPCVNRRADRYGGSLENRMRFLMEIIASMRRAVGPDYPLLCRISGDEFMPGGHTLEDTKIIAPIIERAGICALNVSGGWHESSTPLIQMSVPRGAFVYLAEGVKATVSIPVITSNRINDPHVAERILREGRADLVVVGRGLIADPEWPQKARDGRFGEIRRCIACCECMGGGRDGTGMVCTINPAAGREEELKIEPARQPKNVLVVGGGPGGMEAARIAATRGHRVTLLESAAQLGGQLRLAAVPPHKEELGVYLDYLIGQMDTNGVRVLTGTAATPETIEAISPDAIVLAIGAELGATGIEGVDREEVVTAHEVLAGKRTVGARAIVVGGGLVGCETAELIREQGSAVTILSRREHLAEDMNRTSRWVLIKRLKERGVEMLAGAAVEAIGDEGVVFTHRGERRTLKADTVVLATRSVPRSRLLEQMEGLAAQVFVVGDCRRPGGILEAVEDGYRAGLMV